MKFQKTSNYLLPKFFDTYCKQTPESKEECQDLVFKIYYERNDFEIELTLEEIRQDLIKLEMHERYERCQLLKDIIDQFE